MSPEQAMGQEVDHRSDLFSLGTLIFEAVTGRPPFLGTSTFNTLAKVCSSRHPPAHQVNSRVPVELSNLLDRLLEKSPEHRPQSAREVVVELRFLEKQRISDVGGSYSPWNDTISFALPDTSALFPAPIDIEVVPAATREEGPPAKGPEPAPIEAGEASTDGHSLTLEAPVYLPELLDEVEETTGETTEIQVFHRVPVVGPETRPSICLRALVALRAGREVGESALQRWLGEIQRRQRGRFGELGGLAAESDAGLLFLFERPVRALQFAHFCLQQAAEEQRELGLRAGLHLGEIFLAERGDDPRAAYQASGPATRIPHLLAELAESEQTLLTPEAAALVRGALLESRDELQLRVQSPRYLDELGEMVALVEARPRVAQHDLAAASGRG